jgi:sulfite exporter TauE/SafE
MWILISAIVTASLLGSLHCVGMCGPLAIWASGMGQRIPVKQMALATSLYHVGRLVTYALAGAVAGAAGQLLDLGGETLGVQLLAARVVGGLMILFGLLRLGQLTLGLKRNSTPIAPTAASQPPLITRWLLKLRPYVFRLPVAARGLVTGLLTALLPCGWLYLFALVAAGTGSVLMGAVVMSAFWIGTVPALVGLVTGTQALAVRFRRIIPAAAALVLIVGGGYTATGRGFASLNSLSDIHLVGSTDFAKTVASEPGPKPLSDGAHIADALAELTSTPLPCCAAHAALESAPTVATATAEDTSVSNLPMPPGSVPPQGNQLP